MLHGQTEWNGRVFELDEWGVFGRLASHATLTRLGVTASAVAMGAEAQARKVRAMQRGSRALRLPMRVLLASCCWRAGQGERFK